MATRRLTLDERLERRRKEIAELEQKAARQKLNEARRTEAGPSIRDFDAMGRKARSIDKAIRLISNGQLSHEVLNGIDVIGVTGNLKVVRDRIVKQWHDGLAKRTYFLRAHPEAIDGKNPKELGIAAPEGK